MDLSVIDTCSITEVRRTVPVRDQRRVYAELSTLVDSGLLLFPRQVLAELEEYTGSSKNKPDLPYEWVKRNERQATKHGLDSENLRRVLANRTVARVVDIDKVGVEEADPYVLELANRLKSQGHGITVVTEDRVDKPKKLSLRSACGVMGIPAIGVELLLETRGIWRR